MVSPCSNRSSGVIQNVPSRSDWQLSFLHSYDKHFQIRLYSRDLELSNQNVLHREVLTSPVVILSLVDNSLLVYTADNTLYHYLIIPTEDTIKLHLCGSISFEGVITTPNAVRVLSWMIPSAQKRMAVCSHCGCILLN